MKTTNLEKKQIDLIRESIRVYEKSIEFRNLFNTKSISFADIEEFIDDRGKSYLFNLKEMSHELYRNTGDTSYKEKLYDITIGYIFHEAMKLRENMYLLEYYGPQYDIDILTLSEQEKKTVHEIGILVNKARKKLKEDLKEIKILLNDLIGQLRDLIILYKNNYLMPRFIYENEKSLKNIYGKKGFENLLNSAYADGKHLLVFKAGQSYLESEYYDKARLLFKKAMRLNGQGIPVLFFYYFTSAYYFYFRNMFTKALTLAEKARSMKVTGNIDERYIVSLNILISDLTKEIKKKKK